MLKMTSGCVMAALCLGGPAAVAAATPVPQDVPELLRTSKGAPVTDVATWEKTRRPEILRTFEREMFGVRPVERPADLTFETLIRHDDALLSKAILKRVRIRWKGPRGGQSLLVTAFYPLAVAKKPAPCFVFLAPGGGPIVSQRLPRDAQVGPDDLRETWPVSRLIERGYATVAFDVTDVAEDDDSGFKADVFDCFQDPMDRTSESWGTLSAWAWGASRVMDWLETEPLVDRRHVAVAGLSRRGKTALWAGATDARFAMACACGSGTCGAKLNHIELEGAESLCRISRFRHWFCRNFDKWAGKDLVVPFDQHWLLALMAPRLVAIGSGSRDPGAGPEGERLSAELAKPAWALYGITDGVSHHVREGEHDFRLFDWEKFMDFADAHGWRR